jgi:sugar/nucleoside kinase (ribokinase family)
MTANGPGVTESDDTVVPDYVVLGHITLDRVPHGHVLGGTTSYGALTAQRLGYRAAIVTSGAPREAEELRRAGIQVASTPAAAPTIFENIYQGGSRQQFLRSRAGDVLASTIPPAWRQAPVVHLGPLAQELDPVIAAEFPAALVGATPQGWLRGWDADGRVWPVPWENAAAVLARVDALVFSEQDVNYDQSLIDRYVAMARLAVVTRGNMGCVVYTEGTSCTLAAYHTDEVEPTGAGDVFAGAFFLKYAETKDPCLAADWANCVASFSVEGPGTTAIPTLVQVQERFGRGGPLS